MAIDMSAATKAPPRKAGARKTATPTPVPTETRTLKEQRTEGLMALGQLGQGVCLMTGQWADAMTIGRYFPPLASEVAGIAGEYEQVAGVVDVLIKVGPWGGLIAAGMPFVLQILANHKVLDASKLGGQGVVPPEVLEAQMKAEVAKMQTEAIRQQNEAIRQAQQSQAEYEAMMAEYERESAKE